MLDVETNGLSARYDDLLSISLYKPDTQERYDRFLPLELSPFVETTYINGITEEDLKDESPLSQDEVRQLFEDFELESRIILHYGTIDERFLKQYFERHNLEGFEKLTFFNYKKLIRASRWSSGEITKDNLCRMLGIEGVREVHSGGNDCILEWKLFERIGGRGLLATTDGPSINVFVITPGYLIPASFLYTYPRLGELMDRPYILHEEREVFRLSVPGTGIKRFPANITGVTLENLIDSMLDVKIVDSTDFLSDNKRKLEYLGSLNTQQAAIPVRLESDGSVTSARKEDRKLTDEINHVLDMFRKRISPLIEYIKHDIFADKPILSQELCVDEEHGILALCDLSTDQAVLEIKTGEANVEHYKEQLYYEAHGRKSYIMGMEWVFNPDHTKLRKVDFVISQVVTTAGTKPGKTVTANETSRLLAERRWKERTAPFNVEVREYKNYKTMMRLACGRCGQEWTVSPSRLSAFDGDPCPNCNPKAPRTRTPRSDGRNSRKAMTPEEALTGRAKRFRAKVLERSSETIEVIVESYTGAKEPVTARCVKCDHGTMPVPQVRMKARSRGHRLPSEPGSPVNPPAVLSGETDQDGADPPDWDGDVDGADEYDCGGEYE
ncbi:3'-5' exonuclease [Bifidobacterium miconisargentati]|uniref:3'-5' exonuclease n=1 Tax=Bifidobacterium miconisargentati TaxID=2834437 RepID=UPI001BDD0AC4|nr:3'-5' exonuclease [Bifidobacterium miconisargentati]